MKQKYSGDEVIAPGTVIISAAAECADIRKVIEPVFSCQHDNSIYYIDFSADQFKLGGSSFAQIKNRIGSETPTVKDADYFKSCFNTVQEMINQGLLVAGHDISAGGMLTTLLEMCFADPDLGADIDLGSLGEKDPVKVLFAENSGVIIQTFEAAEVEAFLSSRGISFHKIGKAVRGSVLSFDKMELSFDIETYRDFWFSTSYLLDEKQTAGGLALDRFNNYKVQPLKFSFPAQFDGKLADQPAAKGKRPRAAIIREKGSNSEREMANAMYLAGFDVKDVHMTDLINGRETLQDVQFIGAVGGFSNSDVLGSAKGWAGAFMYNEKAKTALDDFFNRKDTLSVGICNGCQLFVELEMINPEHKEKPRMLHNDSMKHESGFTSVVIEENDSVMLSSLSGAKLGVWISHGEGKFSFPYEESKYNIVAKYGYEGYPANPNGSDYNTAMMASDDGRHLVMMPHIERSIFQWNWANYPADRNDAVSPWLEAFVNARKWIEQNGR
jgi:phosphoribosylformylglycinamidine synthase